MKNVILICILLFASCIVRAQESLTNKEVTAMKNAKVSESLIIAKINSSNCDFDLSAPKLIQLKEAKISDKILKQMIISTSEKPEFNNNDIINLKGAKISDDIIKNLISDCPHSFDTSPEGLISLSSAKVSKNIIKQMMENPVKSGANGAKSTGEQNMKASSSALNSQQQQSKSNSKTTSVSKNCKPFEANDLETNERFVLYGTVFNSGGVLGAIAGNSDNSKETMTVMAGFKGDKTIIDFQLNRIVGEKWRNKNNLRDMFIKKGEKVSVITAKGNISFTTIEETHSTYNNEGSGLFGNQERSSIQAICLATKSQIKEMATNGVKTIYLIITNGNAVTVNPSKGDLRRFEEQMNCLIETEKFKSSPEVPTMELSSEEAISELKKAKDKLDLGLITQQEFEKIKSEMKKYIK